MELAQGLFIAALSYLIGSIPTAYLIGRARGVDIFAVGSGNMGATNTARALGKNWGFLVLFLDSVKGILAIFIARALFTPEQSVFIADTVEGYQVTVVAATSAVLGHNWSLFAALITGQLKGGKGAATAFGTAFAMAPAYVMVGLMIIGAIVIARTRYVSLGALTMAAVALVWMTVLVAQQVMPLEYMAYLLLVAAMIFYRFRENIARLLDGTERRFGERA